MRRARRVGLSLLLLLGVAGSASAECAWVLWANQIRDGAMIVPVDSTPVQGFEKLEHCLNFVRLKEAEAKAKSFYRCLPDTVDPRGPKQ